ncbi:hypothetical protein BKA62DRAFT_739945 [Auriculariales sp. MPI-PUGE-AT-0066]|nr:hypothetical protein BKA62DRAFT_739945 [Auriculariales sp. MPI-PUGE-AT-0066]
MPPHQTLHAARRRHSRASAGPSTDGRKYSAPDVAAPVRRGSAVTDENAMDVDATTASSTTAPHQHPHSFAQQSLLKQSTARRTVLGSDSLNHHHHSGSEDSLDSAHKSRRSPRFDHAEARRTSLPALRLSAAFGDVGNLQPQPVADDVYGGLSSFRFGDATTVTNATTSNNLVVDDEHMDTMSPLPSRTRKQNIDSDDEEDEEERHRYTERAKMRAIDDGTRRPSLPTNTRTSVSGISKEVVQAMREELQQSLERRGSAQAIIVPRRASRVSHDQLSLELGHRKRPSDPQSDPESVHISNHAHLAHHSVEFDLNYILNGSMHSFSAPPSPTSVDLAQGDTFLSHIQRYDDEYGKRRNDWLLARQFQTIDNSGRADPREIWSCPHVGKFCVIRGIAERPGETEPGKLRENQILLKQVVDQPPNGRKRRTGGPAMYIHHHSRKRVVSIFREQNPFKRQESMTPAVSILYSPRDLASFHTRSRPRVQYHDDASRLRSIRTVTAEEPPPIPGSSTAPTEEHVYPPTYNRGRDTTPTLQTPQPRPFLSNMMVAEEAPHRRGHADAFGVSDRMHAQMSPSQTLAEPPAPVPTKSDRGTNSLSSLFKRKGKASSEKVVPFSPPWMVFHPPKPQTEEEMERMLFNSMSQSESYSSSASSHTQTSDSTMRAVASEHPSTRSVGHSSHRDKEAEDEKQRQRVRNLSQSFESVGLIATSRKPKPTTSGLSQSRDKPKNSPPSFIDTLPPDSICFLLPLWPSEAASRKRDGPPPTYRPPVNERRYLVVYFVKQSQLGGLPSPVQPPPPSKKRNRPGASPTAGPSHGNSNLAGGSSSKHGFTPFHVVARLVNSNDLLQAGMRSLDKGLFISGSISDGLLAVPDVPASADTLSPIIIALCNETQSLEFVPEGLDKLGLRVEPPEQDDIDDDPIGIRTWAGPPTVFNPHSERALTSIGRAVVEIIWAACVAVSASTPGLTTTSGNGSDAANGTYSGSGF